MVRTSESLPTTTEPVVAPSTAHPMRPSDIICLLLLGGLWGGSFLFMKVATPEFGPAPLIAVRVIIASLMLLPLLAASQGLGSLKKNVWQMIVLGVVNSAIPFCFLAYATLSLTAGFTSILNATAPFFAAIVAYLWLGQRLSRPRIIGLLVGFSGVVILLWGKASFRAGGSGWAIAAGLLAGIAYGIGPNYSKVKLPNSSPLAIATGSQIAAALCLAPIALWKWPATMPSPRAWFMVSALGIFCTGIAWILYYRLIVHVGPQRTVIVTFLIPAFAMLWGGLFLHERVTLQTVAGAVIILIGTALTVGIARLPRR